MSENRTSSGVRNLRAMFENGKKSDENSSPSRGRSPNDSERSARPLSKVRTNFVAVERPGGTTPQLGLRKQSDVSIEQGEEKMDTRTLQEAKVMAQGKSEPTASSTAETELSEVNGSDPKVNGDDALPDVNGATTVNGISEEKSSDKIEKPASNLNGLTSGEANAQNKAEGRIKEDKKRESIGNILKGSAFEASPPKDNPHADKAQPSPMNSKVPTTPSKAKAAPTPAKVASKAKEAVSPKKVSTPAKVNGKGKETLSPTKDVSSPKKTSSSPGNITTSKGASSPRPTSKPSPAPKSPTVSRTPKTPTTPSVQHSNTDSTSAKPAVPEDPVKKPSRVSNISTTSTTRAPKVRPTAKSQKDEVAKKSPTSPNSKGKSKSPTRPVRLPTHLTAPTASSQAKTSGGPPHARSPSRASTVNTILARNPSTLRKDRATAPISRTNAPITSNIRKKASRASLPAQSTTIADRPTSRVSHVASQAPDEGFLARMMRPTASSASKAHEKIEVHSPPRRSATVKGKHKSGGKEDEKDRRISTKESKAQEGGMLGEDEPVSPSVGKSGAPVASTLDEEKENQNLPTEDEAIPGVPAPEAQAVQT